MSLMAMLVPRPSVCPRRMHEDGVRLDVARVLERARVHRLEVGIVDEPRRDLLRLGVVATVEHRGLSPPNRRESACRICSNAWLKVLMTCAPGVIVASTSAHERVSGSPSDVLRGLIVLVQSRTIFPCSEPACASASGTTAHLVVSTTTSLLATASFTESAWRSDLGRDRVELGAIARERDEDLMALPRPELTESAAELARTDDGDLSCPQCTLGTESPADQMPRLPQLSCST